MLDLKILKPTALDTEYFLNKLWLNEINEVSTGPSKMYERSVLGYIQANETMISVGGM